MCQASADEYLWRARVDLGGCVDAEQVGRIMQGRHGSSILDQFPDGVINNCRLRKVFAVDYSVSTLQPAVQ